MPQVITKTVYTFDELTDKAKETARNWFREVDEHIISDWYDFTKENFHDFLKIVGFKNVDSQFTGFWSQGDGASFDFKQVDFAKLFTVQFDYSSTGTGPGVDPINPYSELFTAWREENATLIRKAKRFMNSIHAESVVSSFGHRYSHSNTRYATGQLDINRCYNATNLTRMEKLTDQLIEAMTELMWDLSNSYYHVLEKEYDYLNSDEQVDKNIMINEYTFTETGKREG